MKAYIVKINGRTICAVQSTYGISNKMLKHGYSVEEAEVEPIEQSLIARKTPDSHGWCHAKRYAMYNGEKIELKFDLFQDTI